MYRTLDDFNAAHDQLADGTARLLEGLTDASLSQRVAPGHRTLGQLAWHLVVTVPEMLSLTGLPLSAIDPHAPPPVEAAAVAAAYRAVSGELRRAINDHWSDADLATVDPMYGQSWPRGLTLTALVHHEIHHRGQLTVLMRQAGLLVPGLYGPAREEWARFGKEAPPY
ncbi:MAG: DinB family protein [Candidatus Krumholzibacteriia bacterium]